MTTKDNTSDQDTKHSAVALLEAAADLGVDVMQIRTVSGRGRVSFDAPPAVYAEAAAAGFLPAPPPGGGGGPATVTATLTTRYLGEDQSSGDSLGWAVDVSVAATDPARPVVLRMDSTDYPLTTGTDYTDVATLNSTGFTVRLTDTASALYDEGTFTQSAGQPGGPTTFTVDVP